MLLTGCTEPTEPTQSIEIAGAWAPALPPNATTGAVYMKITAHEPDRLVTASSAIAHSVEVHQTILEDGIAKMRPLESVALEAHESIAFEPGGAHFMLMGLTEPLEIGNTVELELHFEHAGVVTVRAPVMAPDGDHTDH